MMISLTNLMAQISSVVRAV